MSSVIRALLLLACLSVAPHALASCDPDGVQQSGSIYRICMPNLFYNGRLVIWAHGYQDAGTPVSIPEDQLCFADVCLPDLLPRLGYAFATNSYSKTGLAVVQGMDDIRDLVDIFTAEKGAPERVYIIGASEGGLITTLLVEQYPEIFAAGTAACGPIGSFRYQMDYIGDARVTFEYFWPNLIPGDPLHPPQSLIDIWSSYYDNVVGPTVMADRSRLAQWAAVAHLPFDRNDRDVTLEQTVRDVLRYAVVDMNDVVETIGGFPYGNTNRQYEGSMNDPLLNEQVIRVAPDLIALREMAQSYDTTGELSVPLVTLHTTLDQQVPVKHEKLYGGKVLRAGTDAEHELFAYQRYGHCNFTSDEALDAFFEMLALAGDTEQAQHVNEYRMQQNR